MKATTIDTHTLKQLSTRMILA
uniref:Uncharacterized protein n=1 Tax=Arundo donax TaxID=35708 RepID=A0A0A8Z6R8_ARUDO